MAARSGDARKVSAAEIVSPSNAYAGYVLGVLVTVYVLNFLDRQILAILIPPIKAELQVSDTLMGLLAGTAFAVFYTFAGIPIARWADRGVRRTIIALGLTLWSGMTALCGVAQNFLQLALARIGVGVGEAAGTPPAHSLLSDYFPPHRRATALGIYSAAVPIGGAFGVFLGGWLADNFGWRSAFLAVGVPGLVVALLLRTTVREPPRGRFDAEHSEQSAPTETVWDVFKFLWQLKTFRYMSLATGLAAFSAYGFNIWVPTFLVRVHELTLTQVGLWAGVVYGLCAGVGTFVGGMVCDRVSRRDVRWFAWLPVIVVLGALPFQLFLLLWPGTFLALLSIVPGGFFSPAWMSPTFATVQNLVKPHMRALASAVLLFFLNLIGLGAGPQVVGILNDVLNPLLGDEAVRYSLLIVKLTSIGAAILFVLAGRHLVEDLRTTGALGEAT